MKPLTLALAALLPTVALTACDEGYGYGGTDIGLGYASSPYEYNGYYDGFYGPIYDGYWGTDGFFYYRRGEGDRQFYRGERDHFDRERARGDGWREMHGQFTPRRDYQMPYFAGRDQRANDGRRDRDDRHRDRNDHRDRDDPR